MGAFSSKDKGWNDFLNNMEKNKGETRVAIGYLKSSGTYKPKETGSEGPKQPVTMAQIAAMNEFGAGNVPERSFMRSTLNEQNKFLKKRCRSLCLQILAGTNTAKKGLAKIGEYMATAIKNKIQEGVPPPNSPETVKRKHSDHTLIDTGQLRDTVDWEVRMGKGE